MRNFSIILFLGVTTILTSCGQNKLNQMSGFVQYEGIATPIHKMNIGKIKFTSSKDRLEKYEESDFLSFFEIEENCDLNFTAFLGNSLTNYLHQLDTTLSADDLVKKGNYQFSFYVDGNLLYIENLNPRAGLPSQKNENTILDKPLMSSSNADSWGRFLWMRFYYGNGGETALETGTHQLKIELRPYLINETLLIGDLIAQGELNIKMGDPKEVSKRQIAIQPIQSNSGWHISEENYDKERIRAFNEKVAQNRFKNITSVVVIKDGKLLIEEYFNGSNRNTLHNTRSVGKSFASTVAGIAIDEGYIKGIDQTLNEFYDLTNYSNYSSKKDSVTLKSLLTMSSGFTGSDNDYDSPGNQEKMYPTSDWVKFSLDLPMDDAKKIGKNWDYFTAGVVVLGDIIDKSVPAGLEEYAHKKLFEPLGISNYEWQYTPQDVANTAGGLQMNSLDYAKYGQLYKNNGIWNGNQVLPLEWVEKTLTNYFNESPDQTGYGFLFWNQKFKVNDKSYEAFLCNGNGGNKIFIMKDQPLVIVVTATAYDEPYMHTQVDKMMERYILPAVL